MAEMQYETAVVYCKAMRKSFENLRCPAATIDKVKMCFGDDNEEFKKCNYKCGNYYHCGCSRQRGIAGAPDFCYGETLLNGPEGYKEPCDQTGVPQTCKTHWEDSACRLYRHCAPNMCIIKKIECPLTDTCMDRGFCAPGDGKCYYTYKSDGSSCDDGKFYTHSDTCYKVGTQVKCVGIEDKCLRYAINCTSPNPCIKASTEIRGGCHPPTGSCVFNAIPDLTPCATSYSGELDGVCRAGLCRKKVYPSCQNVRCSKGDVCNFPDTCDKQTAKCIQRPMPEGTKCADDSGGSGICIDGKCRVDQVKKPQFEKVSDVKCDGMEKIPAGTQAYFASTKNKEACEKQCAKDPVCIAFSYGYYTCTCFGGNRTTHPSEKHFGGKWLLRDELIQAAVTSSHPATCYLKKDQAAAIFELDNKAALFGVTVTLLLVFPAMWAFYMTYKQMFSSFQRVTGCCLPSQAQATESKIGHFIEEPNKEAIMDSDVCEPIQDRFAEDAIEAEAPKNLEIDNEESASKSTPPVEEALPGQIQDEAQTQDPKEDGNPDQGEVDDVAGGNGDGKG
eukprot:TRINITY_DN79418_c0_g1_i1.p1 TRINITY_DN79418_c0_g1~~TRINITY_DN79418_c0_g1_i1.p1  ORF type:complete len:630 (+),score=102.79 TRINITY_DN79418_c0_g1_i1:214-1890(+)